jgi:hypothetical protein
MRQNNKKAKKKDEKHKKKQSKRRNHTGIDIDSGEYPVHEEYAEQGDVKT